MLFDGKARVPEGSSRPGVHGITGVGTSDDIASDPGTGGPIRDIMKRRMAGWSAVSLKQAFHGKRSWCTLALP
jgi:hypothetical protein